MMFLPGLLKSVLSPTQVLIAVFVYSNVISQVDQRRQNGLVTRLKPPYPQQIDFFTLDRKGLMNFCTKRGQKFLGTTACNYLKVVPLEVVGVRRNPKARYLCPWDRFVFQTTLELVKFKRGFGQYIGGQYYLFVLRHYQFQVKWMDVGLTCISHNFYCLTF